MSNHLAIATVTAALRGMLEKAVMVDVSGTEVTVLPPDHADLKNETTRLNLYLYQVSPSAAWRNADLPTRRADGTVSTRPQLGLDLYYLLTVYGKATKDDPEIHRVLGSAMRTLHDKPVLTRDDIQDVLNPTQGQNFLAASDLADQVESVRVSLRSQSIDELSKLWQIFSQTPYRLSVVYEASVVLLDGKSSPLTPLPVSKRTIRVIPFHRPVIRAVLPQIVPAQSHITIRGHSLKGEITRVKCGTVALVEPEKITDEELILTLPEDLKAGINTVQVVHGIDLGTSKEPHWGFESNVVPYILRPCINGPVTAKKQGDNKFILTIPVKPTVVKGQKTAAILNKSNPEMPSTYEIDLTIDSDMDVLTTPARAIETGHYFVRIRIDDAESLPEIDIDPKSPTFNEHSSEPGVNIE